MPCVCSHNGQVLVVMEWLFFCHNSSILCLYVLESILAKFWSQPLIMFQLGPIKCYISLLLPRLPKLPSQWYLHWLGNLGKLSSNQEINTAEAGTLVNLQRAKQCALTDWVVLNVHILLLCTVLLHKDCSPSFRTNTYLQFTGGWGGGGGGEEILPWRQ